MCTLPVDVLEEEKRAESSLSVAAGADHTAGSSVAENAGEVLLLAVDLARVGMSYRLVVVLCLYVFSVDWNNNNE